MLYYFLLLLVNFIIVNIEERKKVCCNDIYLSKHFATGSLAESAICFWKKIKVVHQIIIHLVHKI